MCLLAHTHPPLVSQFSRVSSTWGFVTFGIRATRHVEYGLERSMGRLCGRRLEKGYLGRVTGLTSECEPSWTSVCLDPKCPTLVKCGLEHVFISS